MKQNFTITELASDYDITSRTIRHYEDIGLLSPERKGTQRIFNTRDHVRLGLILRGKRIGFSLAEIRELLFLRVDDDASCLEIKEIAMDKVRDIDQRISALTRMRDALTELARTCRKGRSAAECRILESLLADDFHVAGALYDHGCKETSG